MKRRILHALSTLLILLIVSAFSTDIYAQSGSVTGIITDSESGEALPAVNVVIEELQRGTATNAEGRYTIENIEPGTYTIVASYIGYARYTAQITVGAEQLTHDISLQSELLGLEQVVVSALGFEENIDEMAVAQSRVTGDRITGSGEANLVSGLSGKTSGVNIISTSGDPGAGARILIRGANTITGDNEPLFVVDGVPVYNTQAGAGIAGVAQQSRINDLNPQDIKSVRILKGPSAAAVWGSRAANGVVIIETKSGRDTATGDRKINISVGSQVSFDELNQIQELQTTYGQGFGGQYGFGSAFSFGDKISERSGGEDVLDTSDGNVAVSADGTTFGRVIEKNSREVFDHGSNIFKTGTKIDNTLSISGGDEAGNFYLSFGNLTQDGIIKTNSNYDRKTIRARSTRYFDDFTATFTANYTKTESDRIQQGSNVSGLLLGALRTAPDFNSEAAHTVDFTTADGLVLPGRHRSYRNPLGASATPFYDNPFWMMENLLNRAEVNRLQGSTELTYDYSSWLSFTHRLGLDYYNDRRYEVTPIYAANNPSGALYEAEIAQFQINSDLIVRASHDLNQDISLSGLVGWNLNSRETDQLGANSSDIILSTFNRDLSNYESKNPFQFRSTVRTSALYAVLDVSFYDQLFLELTGRSESASTFGPETDNTFFYPSANLAWQFTKLDAMQDLDWLSFGKLRVSYGEAGIQPGPYNTSTSFFQGAFTSSWGDGLNPEAYGGGFARSSQAGNPRLKVERTKELEFGTDLRFFDDRLTLGVSRYLTETEDAILGVDRAPSIGFSSQVANAASIENKGLEIDLQIEAVRTRDFSWVIDGNWSKNINKVTSLAGADEISLAGFVGSTSSAVVGHQLGVLFGGQWRRADEFPITPAEEAAGFTVGDEGIVLNGNGFRVQADQSGVVGDPNPDWRAGIGSTFSYKNLSLNFLVDIKMGGDVWNGTKGALFFFGTHGDTAIETTITADEAANLVNYFGLDPATAQQFGYGTYTENPDGGYTFRGYVADFGAGPVIVDDSYYWGGPGSGFTGPFEQFIEDGGYVRLREVGLNYTLDNRAFRDATGLRSIDFGVKGRNLLLFTDYTGIDPETNLTGSSNGFGLDYFQNPSTRSYFFSIRVNY